MKQFLLPLYFLFLFYGPTLWIWFNKKEYHSNVEEKVAIAKIVSLNGDVRIKPRFTANWEEAVLGDYLMEGEQIFTGEGSKASLEFIKFGAGVSLEQYSILRISDKLPGISKFRRKFVSSKKPDPKNKDKNPKDKDSKELEDNTSLFTKNITKPDLMKDNKSPDTLANNTEPYSEENEGIKVNRDVAHIPIIYPQPKTFILSKKFPANLSIQLENKEVGAQYWGFLWRDGGNPNPVWTGFGRNFFSSIPIPGEGKFIFQLLSEDETATSKTITIEAKKRSKKNDLSAVVANETSKSEMTVIMQ